MIGIKAVKLKDIKVSEAMKIFFQFMRQQIREEALMERKNYLWKKFSKNASFNALFLSPMERRKYI